MEGEESCIQISLARQDKRVRNKRSSSQNNRALLLILHFSFSLPLSLSPGLSHTRHVRRCSPVSAQLRLFSFYCDPCTVKRNPRNRRRDLNPQPVVDYPPLVPKRIYTRIYLSITGTTNRAPCCVHTESDRWKVDKTSAEANEPGTRESSSSRAPNRAPC